MIAGRKDGQKPSDARRVRTLDQDPALQLDALAAAGCTKIFEERASGACADRPGLHEALDYVREGDALVVWKLDRLGRSLVHLIETVTTLEHRGVPPSPINNEICEVSAAELRQPARREGLPPF